MTSVCVRACACAPVPPRLIRCVTLGGLLPVSAYLQVEIESLLMRRCERSIPCQARLAQQAVPRAVLPPAGRDPWLELVSREVDRTPQSPCREAHEGRLPVPLPVGAASAVLLPSQAPGRLVIAPASLCLSLTPR